MKKQVVYPTLMTPYAADMDRVTPWSDYPRPSLKRDSYLCLNGLWDFAVSTDKGPEKYDKILVPFPPESALSGLEISIPQGATMYYRRKFTLPEGFCRGRVILHFGAVDTLCRVWINGKEVATHEGGYLPFSADITDSLEDENQILVSVTDNLDSRYPYGKQTRNRGGMWYTPVSGIWQTVWLESVPEGYINKLKITPTLGSVTIQVFGGEKKKKLTLKDDGEVYEFYGDTVTISPKRPQLWSPEDPHLYYFTVESGEDRIESYFALREISSRVISGIPRLCLNGKPYLFNGLLDQGYYSDGIFLPATAKGYENDILLAKKLGFNMLRKHIKIEPEIFYYLCDRIGIAVFQDMVNNSQYSFLRDTALPTVGIKRLSDKHFHKNPESRRIFEEHMYQTLEHLYNFPSVLYYTVFNEGWGQFCADQMYRKAKAADPTRIIDATSGWFVQNESDVDSRHVYFKKVKLGKITDKPIVISEFGGYAHRVKDHIFGDRLYGYANYDNREDFEREFLRLYRDEIAPLIPLGVSALVYTQLSDVEDETDGLITYDRSNIKVDVDKTHALMSDLCRSIIPR